MNTLTVDILNISGKHKALVLKRSIKVNNISIILSFMKLLITSAGFREVFLYRIGHATRKFLLIKIILTIFQSWFSRIEIPFPVEIGAGLAIPHPNDIVLESTCKLGARVFIYSGVTIGANFGENIRGRYSAIIGDDVEICAGAKIIGPVTIGDRVIIGANSVVTSDIPSDSIAAGIPAKVIGSYSQRILPYKETLPE